MLVADDLSCERGGRLIFSGVSFRLEPGRSLALRGPNGSGKSSLLRLVAGLIRPVDGHVRFEVGGQGADAGRMHYLGHLDAFKASLTLLETLAFWCRVYALDEPAPDEDAILDAIDRVGLAHATDLPIGALSAGQRRRAGLARLILMPRPLWLMDEPTSALDRDGEGLLGEAMRDHLAAGGSILVATHLDLPIVPDATLDMAPQDVVLA
ncbi:heme exporter protein A [Faunimonas pinastri]|uniref:Heme exporter protein A n=1 Tax=Faunimonas pinastri TaxID=1855383 RepID=A0A1H9ME02_9HYPH|nr:heme exporter protein A [Faunimonas pinastri]